MNYFLSALKNYANFSGRARRSEYWYFVLFMGIINLVVNYSCLFAFGENSLLSLIIPGILSFAVLLPGIGVTIRRLHDIDKSGWFYFVPLIPIAGPIWFLILLCKEGTPGDNRFGPNPKEILL